jgi:hypothetical protein
LAFETLFSFIVGVWMIINVAERAFVYGVSTTFIALYDSVAPGRAHSECGRECELSRFCFLERGGSRWGLYKRGLFLSNLMP